MNNGTGDKTNVPKIGIDGEIRDLTDDDDDMEDAPRKRKRKRFNEYVLNQNGRRNEKQVHKEDIKGED